MTELAKKKECEEKENANSFGTRRIAKYIHEVRCGV